MLNLIAAIDLSWLTDAIGPISTAILDIAGPASAIGVFTMALIQFAKDSTPLPNWYLRNWIKNWIQDQLGHYKEMENLSQYPSLNAAYQRLAQNAEAWKKVEGGILQLTVDCEDYALYSLPIEQLCGQMNSAAQLALDYPATHLPLLLTLTAYANPADIEAVLQGPPSVAGNNPNPNMQSFIDSRNRISHQIQRAIDAIQIAESYNWKALMQWCSFGVSLLVALIGLGIHIAHSPTAKGSSLLLSIPIAILAGFLAPVARDLVKALQNLRG